MDGDYFMKEIYDFEDLFLKILEFGIINGIMGYVDINLTNQSINGFYF